VAANPKSGASAKARPIYIKRVKKVSAGHHGGAWKVAYADFVTAMMAFFMVMWILGMDQQLKSSIEGYFSNPVGYKKGYGAGKSPISSGNSPATAQTTPLKLISRRAEESELLDGVTVLKGRGRRGEGHRPGWPFVVDAQDSLGDEVEVTAVPYYAWANREIGAMRVWLPRG